MRSVRNRRPRSAALSSAPTARSVKTPTPISVATRTNFREGIRIPPIGDIPILTEIGDELTQWRNDATTTGFFAPLRELFQGIAPMKYAVIGAAGQLGRDLCPRLSGDVVPLDRTTADLTNPELLRATLAGLRPDVVVNCAAYNFVDK